MKLSIIIIIIFGFIGTQDLQLTFVTSLDIISIAQLVKFYGNIAIISIAQLVKFHGNIAMSVGVRFISFIFFIFTIYYNYTIIEILVL